MKHSKFILPLFLAGLFAGCGNSSNGNDTTNSQPAATETQPAATATQPTAATPPAPTVIQPSTSQPAPGSDSTATQPVATTPQPAASVDTTTSPQLAVVKQDVKQTAEDLKDYTYAQMDDYLKAMQAEKDQLSLDLTTLSAKIDHASDATKAAAKPKLDAVQLQITKLGMEMDDAKNATESIWGDAKVKVQRAYDDAAQTFHDVGQWVDQQPTS